MINFLKRLFADNLSAELAEEKKKTLDMEIKNIRLEQKLKEIEIRQIKEQAQYPKYTRIQVFTEDDDEYFQYTAKLLEDPKFKFLLEDTMRDLMEIMQKINPGDPESVEKRTRAAYRMDGIQLLINKLAEYRAAYLNKIVAANIQKGVEENGQV